MTIFFLVLIYLLSVLAARYSFVFMYKNGTFGKADTACFLVCICPVLNSMWVVFVLGICFFGMVVSIIEDASDKFFGQ